MSHAAQASKSKKSSQCKFSCPFKGTNPQRLLAVALSEEAQLYLHCSRAKEAEAVTFLVQTFEFFSL